MKRFPSLNGLRAVSIIIVIISHFEFQEYFSFHNLFSPNSLGLFSDGQFGVNVFFVISGFLITSLLLAEELRHPIDLKGFYIRRTLRIFPAYYFLLCVYFILQLLGYIKIPGSAWVTSITYTKDLFIGKDWYTGHAWSLSIEEHFYLFWPFLFRVKKARKIAPWLLVLVPIIFKFSFSYVFPDRPRIHDLNLFSRIDSIAVGCLFAINKEGIYRWLQSKWQEVFAFSVILLFILEYL